MATNPLEFVNRRIGELEARVAFLESTVTAAFQLVTFIGRRRHAPGELGDLIETVRKRREEEDAAPGSAQAQAATVEVPDKTASTPASTKKSAT